MVKIFYICQMLCSYVYLNKHAENEIYFASSSNLKVYLRKFSVNFKRRQTQFILFFEDVHSSNHAHITFKFNLLKDPGILM